MVNKKKISSKRRDEGSVLDLINRRFDTFESDYATKFDVVDVKHELLDEIAGVREEIGKLDDKIFTTLDKIVSELVNMREDREIGTEQIRELRVSVDDHEERITKLESSN